MAIIPLFELLIVVTGVFLFFESPIGKKVGKVLPTPFWIYFIPIVLSTFQLLPNSSPVYSWLGLHILPVALFLMLVGTPLSEVKKLGPKALLAMVLGMGTMFVSGIVSFLLLIKFLPPEGGKMAGTLMGTWTGGSANMLSVKEILDLSDSQMGPLIVADTFLSYTWLALLMMGVAYQKFFDKKGAKSSIDFLPLEASHVKKTSFEKVQNWAVCLLVGVMAAEMVLFVAQFLHPNLTFLTIKAWAILIVTTLAVLLALTPMRNLETKGSSSVGTYLLYLVLASIGAKTSLASITETGVILVFGGLMLILHGILLLSLGRIFRIPLFLLATASQANVGGPVSAPIVASVYRPNAAQIGVLMALFGAVFGTYVGALGGSLCQSFLK